ncbi:hypothetical protein MOSE0_D00892 [Monosporozyma servazzii]
MDIALKLTDNTYFILSYTSLSIVIWGNYRKKCSTIIFGFDAKGIGYITTGLFAAALCIL